ncbi:MAG TPA: IS1380 family transposase [Gammaproteobacteria bacterium]|nr:IS1380 family transposase [Gammaproteobacteria bacterium]
MVAQGVLPFQYQEEQRPGGMTALAGLPLYLELFAAAGLSKALRRELCVRPSQGWTDAEVVSALVLLNLAGGECVDDLAVLGKDEGFCRVLHKAVEHGQGERGREALKRRWRRERRGAVPSASAVSRYLEAFHDEGEECKRERGKAFIPAPNVHLRGLERVNREVVAFVQRRSPERTATLDVDATLVETHKAEALYSYKKFKAYQPQNVYWAEQGLVVASQFRDGNVPAGFGQLPVLKAALAALPPGVVKARLREDTAGYDWELLRYCAEGKNKRFGVIEFAVSVDVTEAFKQAVAEVAEADWQPLRRRGEGEPREGGAQWAEVCFVPGEAARKKDGPAYRFLAIREPLAQPDLPGMAGQVQLPFPTMDFGAGGRCKLFGLVTNRDLPGEELIAWHRARCGKAEEAHAIMKHDLAGGQLPSARFGANAAWWAIMILTFNLQAAMRRLVLGGAWADKRLKAIRFALIRLPGRVLWHARRLVIRLPAAHPALPVLLDARRTILALAHAPPAAA